MASCCLHIEEYSRPAQRNASSWRWWRAYFVLSTVLSTYALSHLSLPQTLGGIFILPFYRWNIWGWESLSNLPKLQRWWQKQVLNPVNLTPESLLLSASLHSQWHLLHEKMKTWGFRAELWLAGATQANGAELGWHWVSGVNPTLHHAVCSMARGTDGREKAPD